MKAFSFTLPANTNYYNLWTQIMAIPGTLSANAIIPNRGCELILQSDSAILLVNDSNYANQAAGMPIQIKGNIVLHSTSSKIDLKEIYISGSGAVVSGIFIW